MVDFTRQSQFKTREAALVVDGTLSPGVHVFELVVADQSGNTSKAAQVKVEIVRQLIPVTPVTPVPVVPIVPVVPTRPVTPVIGRGRRRPKKKTP